MKRKKVHQNTSLFMKNITAINWANKPYILFFILYIVTINGVGQEKTGFTIKGKFKGIPNDTKLFLVDNETKDTLMSTFAKNENFVFKGKLSEEPGWFSIRIIGQEKYTTFLLENSLINIEGELNDPVSAKILGSALNEVYKNYSRTNLVITNRFNELGNELYGGGVSNDSIKMQKLIALRQEIADLALKIRIKFIEDHPDSRYSAWLAFNTSKTSLEQKEELYAILSKPVQSSKYGVKLKDFIESSKLQGLIKPGKLVPNFFLQTPEGVTMSLHDVVKKNKLTLLDFWASWCKPCRAEIPNLKKVYEAFNKSGFGILGISSDKSDLAWKKAIAQEGIVWLNGRAIPGKIDPNKIFDINALPTYVLLDEKGRIIAMEGVQSNIESFGGKLSGEDLYKTVSSLLE